METRYRASELRKISRGFNIQKIINKETENILDLCVKAAEKGHTRFVLSEYENIDFDYLRTLGYIINNYRIEHTNNYQKIINW